MPDIPSNSVQYNFLGGEINPESQGRADLPMYDTALALCMNWIPKEEGCLTRRSGTEMITPTHNRSFAVLRSFAGSETCSFAMEFTPGILRFITQTSLVCDGVATVSSYNAGTFTLGSSPGWSMSTAFDLLVVFPDNTSPLFPYPVAQECGLRNATIQGTMTGANTLVVTSDTGQTILGTFGSNALVGAQFLHVLELVTPYTLANLKAGLRSIQAEYEAVILCQDQTVPAQVVSITSQGTLTTDPVFTTAALTFIDGPYLDAFENDGSTISAYTGSITFTNNEVNHTFVASDVGRLIRIQTQPPYWNAGTAYTVGEQVTDVNGEWWTCIVANTGTTPGTIGVFSGVQELAWTAAPNAGNWAWGTITAIGGGGNSCTVSLDATIAGMTLNSANGTTVAAWQLGVYTANAYPTAGCYAKGRLYLEGAVLNRLDASASNGIGASNGYPDGTVVFSPTDPWGNVIDSNGISVVFNTDGLNNLQWSKADPQGILIGTLQAEFLIAASANNDPITPSTIDENQVTQYGSAAVEPVRAGFSTVFVQKYGRRVLEMLADAFTGKFSGRHLNEYAKHLTVSGVAELWYQEETIPIVWARMNNGLLAGSTYRRFSRFAQEPPATMGWHWHPLGSFRAVTSGCVVPGKNGLLDRLFLVTQDLPQGQANTPLPANYFVEIMQPVSEQSDILQTMWPVDQATPPGPGNSGYDCGGGNPSTFVPYPVGADNSVPNMAAIAPNLPVQGVNDTGQNYFNIVTTEATYFPGATMLYNLPIVPKKGSVADQASLSMSVWCGRGDFPLVCGALLSSPALDFAEHLAGTSIVTGMLAGYTNSDPTTGLVFCTTTNYPSGFFDNTDLFTALPVQQDWVHVMISVTDDGAGNAFVICAVDDTVIELNGGWTYGTTNKMWPYASQPDKIKDLGLCNWAIGGSYVGSPQFNQSVTYDFEEIGTYTVPSLTELLLSTAKGASTYGVTFGARVPSGFALSSQTTRAIYNPVATIQGSGGQTNSPAADGIGQVSGYIGNVQELLIWPGQFIDWSQPANRYQLHSLNNVLSALVPISVGPTGAGTKFGAPWVYLTGPPSLFNINRANGVALNFVNAGAEIDNVPSGLMESPLAWPPQPRSL